MQENTKDKEKYCFLRPTGIETFTFIFSAGALQWLHGTTTDGEGRKISNFTLFGDLLARMAVAAGESKGFRRALMLSAGQAQYSEETTCCTVEHGQEAHTQPACHAHGLGACQYPPFKGGIRDDLSVPVRMENSGGWQYRQSPYPRTEGRIIAVRSRTDNGSVLQKRFPLFHYPALLLAPVCFGNGKRRACLAWSGSVQLRGMPRYYRLRTVTPRRPRNSPTDCCPCRSQARSFPLLEAVSRLFKDICYIWNTKIPPIWNRGKRSPF